MYQALKHLENSQKVCELAASVSRFLETYGTPALMGREWGELFRGVEPEKRFDVLIKACGPAVDFRGFFSQIAEQIRQGAGQERPRHIMFNRMALPMLLVYHVLETAMPGQALYSVRTPDRLKTQTGMPQADKAALKEVMDTYPVRLSAHVIRQSLVSKAVAVQYLPFEDELNPTGHELTFDGHFKQGLMEQMYRNRAIFLLDMRCPVYCRFCFRKHKSLRKETSPGIAGVEAALARVRQNREIKEILITGGEPLLNLRNLKAAVDGLMDVTHVTTMRLATRSLAYYPHLFLHHDGWVISYLKSVHARCRSRGKRLEIGVHMVHPDELSIRTLEIIADLTASGIPVYVQTPFLKGVNHEGPVLGELFKRLRQAGAQIYYIFTPCHPIHGTRKYWSPISLSFEAYKWMRENLSDRCMPKLCTATPLGKMEWHTSGWAVEKDESDPDHIWIRTPYTSAYFKPMMGDRPLPVQTRENSGGTLDVRCLIDMGDPSLFLGRSGPVGTPGERGRASARDGQQKTVSDPGALAEEIQKGFYDKEPAMETRSHTGVDGLIRVHKTRVVITLDVEKDVSEGVTGYLAAHEDITDLVVRIPESLSAGLDCELAAVEKTVHAQSDLGRYLCFRLQWAAVQTSPSLFQPAHISRLRSLITFHIAAPLRIEFETWWLIPDQISDRHRQLFSAIIDAGMGIYANTALISGLNTDPGTAETLVHAVRAAGMEFHHVYTEGLTVQTAYNGKDPVTSDQILALASRIRMHCTGREVPLYVRWTPEGERDFGLFGI